MSLRNYSLTQHAGNSRAAHKSGSLASVTQDRCNDTVSRNFIKCWLFPIIFNHKTQQ